MKRIFLPVTIIILVFCSCAPCCAQAAVNNDTVPYTLEHYSVKKSGASIWEIAKKIKVDVKLLARLNQMSDLDMPVPVGTSLLVPVYEKNKGKKNGNGKQVAQPVDTINRSMDSPAIKQPEISPVNLELQKNRLLLIDATLDLNQTLLQGVQASIDSLNVEDRPLTDSKDVQAKLHLMERQRDRILIKPYLAHIQDSLKTEIANETKEKGAIESRLGIKQVSQVSGSAGSVDTAFARNSAPPDAEAKKGIPVSADTLIKAYTTPKTEPAVAEIKPESINKGNPDNTHIKGKDTIAIAPVATIQPKIIKPVIEVPANNPPEVKKHWGSARALPSLAQSFFLQGMRDVPAITENAPISTTQDTVAYVSQFKPRVQEGASRSGTSGTLDSIDLLKSQLLVTRATAAINDRNNALAEDYLKKAVDIDPAYYAAWFAMADLHLQNAYPAKALSEFKICEMLDSSSARLYYKMGSAAFRSGLKNEAYDYFQKSLKLDNNYAPAIMGLGQTLSERKEYNLAIGQFGRVLALNKGFHSAYKSRGIAEYMNGSFAAAIDDFTTYLLFEDRDGASYYYRGMSEIADQNLTDGCPDLTTAVHEKYTIAQKAFEKNCSGGK